MNNTKIVLLIALLIIPPSINLIHIYAQPNLNTSNYSNVNQGDKANNIQPQLVEDKPIFFLSIITILVTGGAIGVTLAVYKHQQNKEANQTRTTILREIKENKEALIGNENERITYTADMPGQSDGKRVNYTNAYYIIGTLYLIILHKTSITHSRCQWLVDCGTTWDIKCA